MNFIQQAYKGKNEWYHWVITIFLVFIGWQIIGVIPLIMAVAAKSENINELLKFAENSFMTAGLDKNFLLFLIILPLIPHLVLPAYKTFLIVFVSILP